LDQKEAGPDVGKRAGMVEAREGHDQLPPASSRLDETAGHRPEVGNAVPSTRCLIVLYDQTGLYLGSDIADLPFAARDCRREYPGVMAALSDALVQNGVAPAGNLEAMRIEISPLWTPPARR
jgi:hypothetical protein